MKKNNNSKTSTNKNNNQITNSNKHSCKKSNNITNKSKNVGFVSDSDSFKLDHDDDNSFEVTDCR